MLSHNTDTPLTLLAFAFRTSMIMCSQSRSVHSSLPDHLLSALFLLFSHVRFVCSIFPNRTTHTLHQPSRHSLHYKDNQTPFTLRAMLQHSTLAPLFTTPVSFKPAIIVRNTRLIEGPSRSVPIHSRDDSMTLQLPFRVFSATSSLAFTHP